MSLRILRKANRAITSAEPRPSLVDQDVALIRDFLDADWYRNTYPDVDFATTEPAAHYLAVGAREGRAPHPLFDVDWYVQRHPEIQDSTENPLLHLLKSSDRGAGAHPRFDGAWYLEQYPDIRASRQNAFQHYIRHGAKEGRRPHPLFGKLTEDTDAKAGLASHDIALIRDFIDADWYQGTYTDVDFDEIEPAAHYFAVGAREGRAPHPLFDVDWYVRRNPELQDGAENPLLHLLKSSDKSASAHPLFDGAWYLEQYKDIRASQQNAFQHYILHGAKEGRQPHPLFDVRSYRQNNPGSAFDNPLVHYLSGQGFYPNQIFAALIKDTNTKAGLAYHDIALIRDFIDADWYQGTYTDVDFDEIEPATHYFAFGAREGRAPHPLFDVDWYVQRHPELQDSTRNPLLHLLKSSDKSASAHPLFDGAWYLEQYKDIRVSQQNAFQHYVLHGAKEGRQPHPLFDAQYYQQKNPGKYFENPLLHYILGQGTHPNLLFDEEYYRNQITDLDFDNMPLLLHFVLHGAKAGYNPNPYFDCAWYVDNHENLAETGENPLAHFLRAGLQEGRDPHPLFDLDWYRFANPDIAGSGLNPLGHFLSSGRREGRSSHPPDTTDENCAVLDIPYEIRRSPATLKDRDACVFVTFSRDGAISQHTRLYVEALRANDVAVILTIVTEGLDRPLPPFTETTEGLVVRLNHGWDFAAWAAVMAAIPEVWTARSLILTNDSIFGPTDAEAFRTLLTRVRTSSADVVALTDSHQVAPHLMSYFVVLKDKALKSERIRRFWNDVRSLRDKNAVINFYELSSLTLVNEARLTHEILFPTQKRFSRERNPTLVEWRSLLARGFPFIKVQLLRDRLAQSDADGWRTLLGGNAALVEAVDSYLETAADQRRKGFVDGRPIPAPRKRFKRSRGLTTFYGAVQSTRPTKRTDLCLEVPLREPVDPASLPDRVAVLVHIFYPEMCAEIATVLGNIPTRTDLFVSTDTAAKKSAIEQSFADFNGTVTVAVFPNIGRDIAPMLVGFASVFDRYDIFLHIHSKRSPHSLRMAPWRTFLFDNLLGSPEIVASILALLTRTETGIVFSDHFEPVRSLLNWGGNYDRARVLLKRAGVELSKDLVLDFPSSSFFWGRSDALRPLLDLKLDWSDFDPEAGQVDGTLAHAIERSILYLAESRGYSWTKVGRAGAVAPNRLVPAWTPQDVARTGQRLLGNRLPPLSDRRFTAELVSITTRPDRQNTRKRFNLIIPTLAPERIFGGITTAIRIFDEIAESLGPDYDLRIICQSLPLDLEAMVGFPEFRLVPLGTKDDYPKVIVDVTDQESGELGIREGDVFFATAWWTAVVAFDVQQKQTSYFGRANPVIYLIQDHEPDFYGWSTQYGVAQETYSHGPNMIALINSEELAAFMTTQYPIRDAYVVRFKLNPKIGKSLKPLPRERIICIYARPGTPRNAFPLLCAGISRWQQNDPARARLWRIEAAGETFSPDAAGSIEHLSVVGKLTLDAYGELLSKASIGISLMLSPHPSYPPLEMASAGMQTITNAFASKDLSLRSPNVISIPHVTADAIAAALEEAVTRAEERIGQVTGGSPIAELPCASPDFDSATLARRIRAMSPL